MNDEKNTINAQSSLASGVTVEENKPQAKNAKLQKTYRRLSIVVTCILIIAVIMLVVMWQRCSIFGHNWAAPNCLAAKTCSNCGITEGDKGEHSWTEGSSKEIKTCAVCNYSIEYFYHEGELIAWTEYLDIEGQTQQEVVSYTFDGKQINWYKDGRLSLWEYGSNKPYTLYFADGKVYYFYYENDATDGDFAYLDAVAQKFVYYRSYICGAPPYIVLVTKENLSVDEYSSGDFTAGQAVFAYDVFGNEYVIIHIGGNAENPGETVIVKSTYR